MSASADSGEFTRAIGPVARELLGEPTQHDRQKRELRFGTRGSMSVNLDKGTWHDHEAGRGGGVIALVRERKSLDHAGAVAWLRERGHLPDEPRPKPREMRGLGLIVAEYDYVSADGKLLFQVVRFADPKTFRQRKPDGKGGWSWKMEGVQRLLYRLPAVVAAVAEGRTVYIVEGEKAVHALESIGLTATCSPGGAGKWRPTYNATLAGADVVILPDHDPQATDPDGALRWHPDGRPVLPGQDHAADVARHLQGAAKSVRVVMLPDLPPKGDPWDWVAAGGTAEKLEALLPPIEESERESADLLDDAASNRAQPRAPRRRKPITNPPEDAPVIRIVAGELHINATEGESAILQAGTPIFQRGGALVRPVSHTVPASRGRTTVAAGIGELTVPALVDVLCYVATWERFDARAKDWLRINPPTNVAQTILSRDGRWRLPSIAGVITTPTLRPDGSVLSAAGYDPATRLYHVADPDLQIHPAVHKPTRAAAEGALQALCDLLQEFPFTTPVAKSVALSALVTPVVRGALSVAPMHLFRASTAGTGKSYLSDVASVIATGRPCPVISAAPDEGETEKRLAGLLLAGFPVISIDNVNGELGGDLLCQAIERPLIRLRRLGGSDITEIESTATIFATGNNARVRGDMVRRCLISDLDAQQERPELRTFQGNPVAAVLADRGRFVSACLVIVRAWLQAGAPDRPKPIASFEDWSSLVRGALLWLHCADPAASMEQAREDDPELGELRETMAAWDAAFGNMGVTCKAAIAASTERAAKADEQGDVSPYAVQTEARFPDLHAAFSQIAGVRGAPNSTRLGNWLVSKEGRIVGNQRFKRDGTTHGATRWRLQTVR